MNIQQLKVLGLEKRWPKLARLQGEISSLEKRNREADTKANRLRAELAPARERDLNLEAKAIRSGDKVPEPKHEREVQAKLDRAVRDAAVMARALQDAQTDLSHFLAKHQGALFEDVSKARAEIASEAARAAREALVAYSKHEDVFYLLKSLAPPPQPVDSSAPAQRLTQAVIGIKTTGSSGPARGDVEAMLQHLISLGNLAAGGQDGAGTEEVA